MAERERSLQRRPSQIERPVPEPQALVDGVALLERERRRIGVGEDLELSHGELDLAGWEIRVDVLRIAAGDRAGGGDHVLRAQAVRGLMGLIGSVRMEHELHDP